MPKRILLSLPLAALLITGNVGAADDEMGAVLDVVQKAFDAIASGDPDDQRAVQLADGTSISFRPLAGGKPGELEFRMATNEELVSGGSDDDPAFNERWTGEPTVMIRGPIAVVWGEYEFRIDGEFSHCGIDSVDLVKLDGEWKIANWMWTVEREGCPTGPSR